MHTFCTVASKYELVLSNLKINYLKKLLEGSGSQGGN
jgi:hypothetical protein